MAGKLSGLEVPQANRIDRVIGRVRALVGTDEGGWKTADARDDAYYRRAAAILGWLDAEGRPTASGRAVASCAEPDALAQAAVAFERSPVGRAWMEHQGVDSLLALEPSRALQFLKQATDLGVPTAIRRAATLRQWLESVQPLLRSDPARVEAARATVPREEREDEPGSIDRFLDSSLDLLLPTRMVSWAERNGLRTFRDLARRDPKALLDEPNLGRRSIRQTSEVFERHTGQSWSALHERLGDAAKDAVSSERAVLASEAPRWDELARRFPPALRARALSSVELPTRMRNFAQSKGLATVGDLLAWRQVDLAAERNLGRGSIAKTLVALRDLARMAESGAPEPTLDPQVGWLAIVREHIARQPPTVRLVLTRRAALHGEQATLLEVGEVIGVSRERARQIESRGIEALKSAWWMAPLRERLLRDLGDGARELADLATEPLWAGADEHAITFDYVLQRVLDDVARVLEVEGRAVVATSTPQALAECMSAMQSDLRQLVMPVPESLVLGVVERHASGLTKGLVPFVRDAVGRELSVAERPEGRVVTGYGRTRHAEILALFEASEGPIPVAELESRFGRGKWPEELIYVERGVLALPKHVPDFDLWRRRLVPLCIATMVRQDPSRQWSVVELLDAIAESAQLPEWLGHWHLASMIRVDGRIRYLGRLRVAVDHEGAPSERIHMRDEAARILRAHGAPMSRAELLDVLRRGVACGELTFNLMVLAPPFLQLDAERVGLSDRDLPGGPEAVAEAVEALEDELEQRGEGLDPLRAMEVVHELGEPHVAWTAEMVRSVARQSGLFRLNRSGSIGLADWDDARMPTRAGVIRGVLDAHGGRAPVEAVLDALAARFGAGCTRPTLYNLAHAVGARLSGAEVVDVAVAAASVPPPPPDLPDARHVRGLPASSLPVFQALLAAPLEGLAALRAGVDAHVAELERRHGLNELLDPDEGRALARACHRLLDRVEGNTSEPSRRLAWAAVRYFVLTDDAEADFEIGGLDDDVAVVDAVATHLGYLDCRVERR